LFNLFARHHFEIRIFGAASCFILYHAIARTEKSGQMSPS
jgi:hypothetical protein